MSLLTALVLAGVIVVALFLLALGTAALLVPAQANRFLPGFASSPSVHFTEMFLRLVAGAALVHYAPNMHFTSAFQLFGWVLLGTTACLLFVPWQWHRRFAQLAVPRATRYIALIGLVSLTLGGFVLFAVTRGQAA
jgi:hypothetical protein